VEVNEVLADQPEAVNEDCYGDGWMIVIELDDEASFEGLLDADAYVKNVQERSD
jgi:glycine cleavage system H protein